jgi:IS5 family transposase
VAHKTGAIGPKDLERVVVDTTVQPKAVAHPTDARLLHRAIIKLVLRQAQPCAAAPELSAPGQARRHHDRPLYPRPPVQARPGGRLKFLRIRLGRIIRDNRRKIDGDPVLEARFGPLLGLAQQVRSQDQHQRGPKVYALHAPEVECIGKCKARAPYATPVTSSKGGQFVLRPLDEFLGLRGSMPFRWELA